MQISSILCDPGVDRKINYDRAGRVRATLDPNGVITEFTSHPRGWLLTRTVKAPPSRTTP